MTEAVRVVCRPAVRDGFGLAGVRAIPAIDAVDAAAVIERLAAQPGTGVVLVEEPLYRALPEILRDALERRSTPIVVPFPGPQRAWDRPSAESDLVEVLRGALGYRVRLR